MVDISTFDNPLSSCVFICLQELEERDIIAYKPGARKCIGTKYLSNCLFSATVLGYMSTERDSQEKSEDPGTISVITRNHIGNKPAAQAAGADPSR